MSLSTPRDGALTMMRWKYIDPRSLRQYMLKERMAVRMRPLLKWRRWALVLIHLEDWTPS